MKEYKDRTGLTWEMINAMSSEERAEYGIGEEPDWDDEDEAKWLKDKPRFIEELVLEGKYLKDYPLDDLLEVYGVERAAYDYYMNNKPQFVKDAIRPGFGLDDCLRFYNCTQEEYDKYFPKKTKLVSTLEQLEKDEEKCRKDLKFLLDAKETNPDKFPTDWEICIVLVEETIKNIQKEKAVITQPGRVRD